MRPILPFSAVFYFDMLIPLALREQSPVVVLSFLLIESIAAAGPSSGYRQWSSGFGE